MAITGNEPLSAANLKAAPQPGGALFDGTKTFDIQGYFSLRPLFQAIADAIRSCKGGNTKIKAYNFPEEIRKL